MLLFTPTHVLLPVALSLLSVAQAGIIFSRKQSSFAPLARAHTELIPVQAKLQLGGHGSAPPLKEDRPAQLPNELEKWTLATSTAFFNHVAALKANPTSHGDSILSHDSFALPKWSDEQLDRREADFKAIVSAIHGVLALRRSPERRTSDIIPREMTNLKYALIASIETWRDVARAKSTGVSSTQPFASFLAYFANIDTKVQGAFQTQRSASSTLPLRAIMYTIDSLKVDPAEDLLVTAIIQYYNTILLYIAKNPSRRSTRKRNNPSSSSDIWGTRIPKGMDKARVDLDGQLVKFLTV